MILVGYIRVSSDSQEDSTSLPHQRASIEEYCQRNSHILFNVFSDVASGKSDERQGFQFALQSIFAGLADGLVVHKLDRFSRSLLDSENLKTRFNDSGKQLISISDPVEITKPDGELFYQLKSAFSEYERKVIHARCEAGRQRKLAEGGTIGGAPPFGWTAMNRTLVRCEKEQQIISLIYQLRYSGMSCVRIADRLNELGHRTKKNRLWRFPQIYTVLRGLPPVVKRIGA